MKFYKKITLRHGIVPCCLLLVAPWAARLEAAGVTAADLEEVVITARRVELSGRPRSASEGTVLAEQLELRPLLRVGEMLEVIPGLIVTQHTGDGKANQYFLRGFNLDHGTDFSVRVDGVPVNLPTHAHGQGYLDMNFVIPELVDRLVYQKGPYHPELGDFSAAGAAKIDLKDRMAPMLAWSAGEYGYSRLVAAGSTAAFGGNLLAGLEWQRTDGPWVLPEDLRKTNALLKWSREFSDSQWSVYASRYRGQWVASDQIPLRALERGELDRYGYVDPTSGGESSRDSLAITGRQTMPRGELRLNAYVVDYALQLFSNFTYALNEQGDQFEQYDDRRVSGGSLAWQQPLQWGDRDGNWRSGAEWRRDEIAPVGLHLTAQRERYATVREDAVTQELASVWSGVDIDLTPRVRAELGLRFDRLAYSVRSSLPVNSGRGSDSLVSPKATFVFGPWRESEFFFGLGQGFHSNDVRGATISVDPNDGTTPVERVTPLVPAKGIEVGLRTALIPRSQLSLALWRLTLASELLFVGDGGFTEPTRPSRRQGVELALYSRPLDWFIIDADYAISRARFTDRDPAGPRIPGAVEQVASLGLIARSASGWFGGLRGRYLGAAALVEDNRARSSSTTLLNFELGRELGSHWQLTLGLYNVLDSRANDITYFYESRLPGESQPVEDFHFHPVEPRTLRVTLRLRAGSFGEL